mmetsp:Transcript_42625/g.59739  ORF Transcript_42625/g.59739 Transcript_42625/m.59739 type:complete len:107 (+) Transcript_42625:674-994(+)
MAYCSFWNTVFAEVLKAGLVDVECEEEDLGGVTLVVRVDVAVETVVGVVVGTATVGKRAETAAAVVVVAVETRAVVVVVVRKQIPPWTLFGTKSNKEKGLKKKNKK